MRQTSTRKPAIFLFTLCACFFAILTAGFAQSFPNHFDDQLRIDKPDLTAVPSIRVLAVTAFPPFSFRLPSGEMVGYNIDLAESICDELDIVCTIQSWPFEQAADALADNQGDMLLGGLEISPEHAELFDFSAVYFGFPARIVLPAENAAGFDALQLNDKSLAVRAGSNHEAFALQKFANSQIVPFDTEIDALDAVKNGMVDAFFGDAMRASFWLNENADCCAFVLEPFYRPDAFGRGLAMAFPAERTAVRRAVDYALWRLWKSGKLNELYLRWFPLGFY